MSIISVTSRSNGKQGVFLVSRASCLVIRFVLLDNSSGMPFDLVRGKPCLFTWPILQHLLLESNLDFLES